MNIIIDILIILAISNVFTEQKIGRTVVNFLFNIKPENFLYMRGFKKFFYELFSCWSCLSFHVAYIYYIIKYNVTDFGEFWWMISYGLISMLISSIIMGHRR
jgi:hypothetical protein